ncbi:AMP-binding protein, partial [Listeria innocua]
MHKLDEKIIFDINQTTRKYPNKKNVVELFENIVIKFPQKTAVVCRGKKWSYSELNRRSNQVAHRLVALGIEPGEAVGIVAERSLSMIAGLIGIIKAGAVYVPIDPKLPESRIQYLINDANIKMFLTTENVNLSSISINKLNIEDSEIKKQFENNVDLSQKSDELIYIMYTSGTTGVPKGVKINHQNVVNLVFDQIVLRLNENIHLLQTGSLAFDATTYEIWGTLLNGGTLFILKEEELLNVDQLKKIVNDFEINTLWLTVTLFNQLVQEKPSVFDSVRQLTIGGERPNEEVVRQLYKYNRQIRIFNGYGPTETTTFATV